MKSSINSFLESGHGGRVSTVNEKEFSNKYDITMLDLGIGHNPVNPTSFVYMKRKKP